MERQHWSGTLRYGVCGAFLGGHCTWGEQCEQGHNNVKEL